MKRYRKKPVVIEAVQLNEDNFERVVLWIHHEGDRKVESGNHIMIIHTLEGEMRAEIGDWIIKGVNGEFYPCKNNIFRLTYEEVLDE